MNESKRQYRIGELAKTLAVEKFVIRFWEKQFGVKPIRSKGGQRFYEEKDARTFAKIKKLLYDQGFTIAGAKKILNDPKSTSIKGSHKTTLDRNEVVSSDFIAQLKNLRMLLGKLREQL